MKVFLSLALIVFSIVGLADSSYITYEELSGHIPVCGAGFDCGQVLNSPWAWIGPMPLSALGMVYYATVLCLAIAYFLEWDWGQLVANRTGWLIPSERWLLLLTSTGFLFSLFLIGLMAWVIEAWCLFCLFSAASSTALFIVSIGLQRYATRS
ncbi:MAG TPA: vitamin K epoxide reductase family protein [Vitreimonas sp.]|nr:vitamin K epoxide reductase family protein [Vitreimonas sp.]